MNNKIVKKFADSDTVYKDYYPAKNQKYIHWVEYTDGTKETISGNFAHRLWETWVISPNTRRYHEDGFTIFEYKDR